MKAAIYSQKNDSDTLVYLREFISKLEQEAVSVVLHGGLSQAFAHFGSFDVFRERRDLEKRDVDLFFSFGGDGTILNALMFIQDLKIPVVGVNTGRLGFLASFSKLEVFSELKGILEGKLSISERSLIKVNAKNIDFPYALNDVSISRKETTSMITVESYVDAEFLNTFWGDGLIVSTPTGSTAYSLSCGGPIIFPRNNIFAITPMSPHNLNVRPLVVRDDSKIRLKVESRVPQYSLSLDSRLYHMDTQDEILIEKAAYSMSLVLPHGFDFFSTIRKKLLWGKDERN